MHRPPVLIAIACYLMLSSSAPAQVSILSAVNLRVVLDNQTSQEIRQDVLAHLDDWAAANNFKPGRDPKGQPWIGIQFPEITVEAKMICDGRTFGLTSVSTQMHLILYLQPEKFMDEMRSQKLGANGLHVVKQGEAKNAEGDFKFALYESSMPERAGKHGLTRAGVVGCLVTAFLPGFRSNSVTIPELAKRGPTTISPIEPMELHRIEGASGVLFSPTFWSAPAEARSLVKEATLPGTSDPVRASLFLERAVDLDPQFAEAWMHLAAVQELTDPDAAASSYKKAIAADPAYILPYQPLLRLETRQAAWKEVIQTAIQLLKLCPHGDAEALYDIAFAADQLQRAAQAEESARKGIAEDPDRFVPELERLLGRILAKKGDQAGAAEHLRNYLHLCADAPDAAFVEREISLLHVSTGSTPGAPSREEQERVWAEAAQSSLSYAASLPNFVCTEEIQRDREPEGELNHTLRLQLTYFDRKEDYRLISVNGRPTESSYDDVGGAITKGEFGSELSTIFSESSHTEFAWDRSTTLRKRPANVYHFRIPLAHSTSKIEFRTPEGGHVYSARASEQGFVYIDSATNKVMRISWQTADVPLNFQMQSGATQLDYDFMNIGGASYLLPMAAEIRVDAPGERYRNSVEFRDYRRFGAESNITFGGGKL